VNRIVGWLRIEIMQRRLLTLTMVLALALGLAACGSSSKDSNADAPAGQGGDGTATAAVTIENFKFTTDPVKAGSTVTVANDDTATHSVASDEDGLFETGEDIEAGASSTFEAPEEPGTYPFHCGIHTFMKGTLTVEA
jgi:plastocyanin